MKNVMLTLSPFVFFAMLSPVDFAGCKAVSTPDTKPGPSLDGAVDWLNSPSANLATLRGKVVLISFWTYTCINWRRTLPYLRQWEAKYRDHGLIVIGIHTPEFAFEHEVENVRRSLHQMNIVYPVAIDNNYTIWNSFENNSWPAIYLIDANGKLRYRTFGEGNYVEPEIQIQKLLKETSTTTIPGGFATVQDSGYEAAADWKHLASPENFLGFERTIGFASPEQVQLNQSSVYTFPRRLQMNGWALSGDWSIGREYLRLQKGKGNIRYRFHARDVHLIMGAADPAVPIHFQVLLNGKPPGRDHGLDINSNGEGVLLHHGMYQLIRQQGTIGDCEFEIQFEDSNPEVFDFTFG
jgi:thiol-disulfide isomerase/thioredoxin